MKTLLKALLELKEILDKGETPVVDCVNIPLECSGICGWMAYKGVEPMLDDKIALWNTWEKFSGKEVYPVPYNEEYIAMQWGGTDLLSQPNLAFEDAEDNGTSFDMSTEYGQLRYELLLHMIKHVTVLLNESEGDNQ